MRHVRQHPTVQSRAFTLLEMMLSIAVFLLLVGSAFSLVGATTELMAEISDTQNEAAIRLRFVESCRVAFESTTGESNLEFDFNDRGNNRSDTYLSLLNSPGAFDFGLNTRDEITRVVLATEARSDGFFRTGIYYMTDSDYEEAKQSDFDESGALYLELIPRLRQLSWRFYDDRRKEWVPSLERDLDTSLVEMTLQTDSASPPLRSVFYCLKE
tara:strand:- start:111 stop:749 length:639 start_codon:yes stop_codon:yes gene_type:complete